MKTYLQNQNSINDDVIAFNQENLTSIRIIEYDNSFESEPKKYEDFEDFIWALNYHLQNDYEVCDREVYNGLSVKYGEFHNEINKEL